MSVVPIEDRSAFAVAQSGRMSPAIVKQQAEEIRELMRSALVENIDFGKIPGTPKPTLYQPGAQWLLKWAGYGFRNVQGPIILDRDGRPYGVVYTCSVHLLGSQPEVVVATCDGYCGYDEPDREEHINRWDKAVPRSPWNTIVKMAQKRALVGAALAATGASGIFTQDVEDVRAAEDPEAEFRRGGWAGRVEAEEVRTRQFQAIKDQKLGADFNAWRQTSKVPAFSDGWHTKKESDEIEAWLKSKEIAPAEPTPEEKIAEASAALDAAIGPEKAARAAKARGKAKPEEGSEAPAEQPQEPEADPEAPACEHNWFEQDDHSLICPDCGEVGDEAALAGYAAGQAAGAAAVIPEREA